MGFVDLEEYSLLPNSNVLMLLNNYILIIKTYYTMNSVRAKTIVVVNLSIIVLLSNSHFSIMLTDLAGYFRSHV